MRRIHQLYFNSVAGYVHSELVALSQSSGLPYRLLTSIRQSLLAQFSCLPATAANLWQELEDTAAILPTGSTTAYCVWMYNGCTMKV